jgi:transposase-like protein
MQCLDCKKVFTPDYGFWKMKSPPHIVVKALDLHDKGMSYGEIVIYLWQQENFKTTKKTIWDWVKKYSKMLNEFTSKQAPEIEGRIHMDETYVKVDGEDKYYFDAVDQKTKMSIADHLSHTRDTDGAINLFLLILESCIFLNFIHFVSDKLDGYRIAFKKLFNQTERSKHHGIVKLDWGTPIRQKKYGIKHNNNAIERHNRYTKRKVKLLCHYKSFESAQWSLKLRRILYNYCRPHEELKGLTPAERAGIKLDLGRNKLWSLIKLFHANLILKIFYPFIDFDYQR